MRGPFRKMREKRLLNQLMQLRLPQDEERLRAGLAEVPEYACYDLSLGWPHVHKYSEEVIGRELVLGRKGRRVYLAVYALTCDDCGMVKVEIRRELCRKEYVRVCPYCGSQELRHNEEPDLGFNTEECLGCGHIEFHDFFETKERETCTSRIYHTEYQQPEEP